MIKFLLFLLSVLVGVLLYVWFFMDILPMFFANMENIEKNILAILIIILTVYVLLNIVFKLDTKIDRYLILVLYLLVLVIGLLRLDQQHFGVTGLYSWNPFGFVSDIKNDNLSMIVMFINLIIFSPLYFLLACANVFDKFLPRFIVFEIFVFLIEYLQVQLKVGVFDLSDIFLYNVGFFVGYLISLPVLRILKKGDEFL